MACLVNHVDRFIGIYAFLCLDFENKKIIIQLSNILIIIAYHYTFCCYHNKLKLRYFIFFLVSFCKINTHSDNKIIEM